MFLKTSAYAGAALASTPLRFPYEVASASKPQKVVVVGAGIAGLVAALELTKSGHEVSVLEARLRPGGRVHTLRDEFSDGLYAEAGAYDFGDAYEILQRYIKEFNLAIDDGGSTEKQVSANDNFYLGGKRYTVKPGTTPDWPYQLSAEERKLSVQGLWNKYVLPTAKRAGEPMSAGWPNAAAQELDSCTINEFLRKQGASEGVISLMTLSFLGEDYDHVSALADVMWQSFFDRDNGVKRLRGGNDLLPKAFAAKLGNRVHYGAAVRKLTQDKDKVTLSVSRNQLTEQVQADRVVLAIPFSVLRNVELGDSFSPQKRLAISNLRYESQTRVYLQSRTRFWIAQGTSGYAYTDLPIGIVLDHTDAQPGPRAIIGTETAGPNARIAAAMKPDERVRWGLGNIAKVFPEIKENFEGGTSVAWDEEPWSLGGTATYAPGELIQMLPHVATVEGRVHFAGEHTSTIFTMEGAAQSGVRVAREINAG